MFGSSVGEKCFAHLHFMKNMCVKISSNHIRIVEVVGFTNLYEYMQTNKQPTTNRPLHTAHGPRLSEGLLYTPSQTVFVGA